MKKRTISIDLQFLFFELKSHVSKLCVLVLPVTIGHETVMAKTTFFGCEGAAGEGFDFTREYAFQEQLLDSSGVAKVCGLIAVSG